MPRVDTEIRHEAGEQRVYGRNNSKFFAFDGQSNRIELFGTVLAASTDGALIKAGSSTTPASTPIATAANSQSMVRIITGLDHTGSYGVYFRSYIRTAGISADAFRAYGTVLDVAAGTVRGAHISLSFGSTGTVTGLGVALECTLHIANQATQAGTLAALKLAIESDGATSDPNGAQLSYIRFDNQGNTTGDDDVDTDAYLFDIQGHATGTGTLFQTVTTAYTLGEITNSLKIRVGGTVYHVLLSTTGAQAT